MSDREIVTFDSQQFARLDMHLERIGNGLWAINEQLKPIDDAIKAIGSTGGNNNEVLLAINNLTGKVDKMSSNLDRIEKEAADMAENVELVRTAVGGLNTTVTDLKAVVADLTAQVAQGQLDQARLDAAASKLEKADDDIDAIVLPPVEPPIEPPVEP